MEIVNRSMGTKSIVVDPFFIFYQYSMIRCIESWNPTRSHFISTFWMFVPLNGFFSTFSTSNFHYSVPRPVLYIIADTLKLNYWNGDDNLDNNMLLNIDQHVEKINSKRMALSGPIVFTQYLKRSNGILLDFYSLYRN